MTILTSDQKTEQNSATHEPDGGPFIKSFDGVSSATLYQALTNQEDQDRTNKHYGLPARFFELLIGGRWLTYSCSLWDNIEHVNAKTQTHLTRAQEQKLDVYAEMLELKPGSRVLDVGAGWGGPLIYLTQKYGIVGHGLMLSPQQHAYATKFAEREGVDVQFEVCHWEQFRSEKGFDAVMTDEVIVHFYRLEQFFGKCMALLVDDGLMVNKEIHFTHPRNGQDLNKSIQLISRIFGDTGNYRTLGEELQMATNSGFSIEEVRQLGHAQYELTGTAWLHNLRTNKDEMIELTKDVGLTKMAVYKDYRRYLGLVISAVAGAALPRPLMESHWVKCRKLPRRMRANLGIIPSDISLESLP